jgi:two-component system sensor histidine kinase PilS (NtrC family)
MADAIKLQRKLLWLLVSRVAILLALLVVALVLGPGDGEYSQPISVLALVVLALSLLYVIGFKIGISTRTLIPLQLVNDVLLTSWLVYETRDVLSPFVALYLVIIFAASMLSSRGDLVLITILTVFAYSALAVAVLSGALPRAVAAPYAEGEIIEAQVNFGFALVAILAVAALSIYLTDLRRRADADLAVATRDLADLRVFNERIINSMRSGLVTADLEGRITSFNRAAEEITDYRAEEVAGEKLADLFPGVDVGDSDAERAERGIRVERADVAFTRRDGSVARLGFNVTPLIDYDGAVRGAVLIFQDLTDVFELEQEVRRQEKLAALGALAAGLAHEIRNPLASMRGSVQVLAGEADLEGPQKRLLEIIFRESDRLNQTVTDFLAYARPAPHTPAEFDIKRSIADAVALLRNSPELASNHEIVERYPDGECPFVGDQGQMRQIFWNLSRNALQAMPSGGRLTVELERMAKGGYRLVVADEGDGMTPEQIESLFVPFASQRPGGTGLGMPIVYQFITDHEGRIGVESSPGRGTRVTVVLPGRRGELRSAKPRETAEVSS